MWARTPRLFTNRLDLIGELDQRFASHGVDAGEEAVRDRDGPYAAGFTGEYPIRADPSSPRGRVA